MPDYFFAGTEYIRVTRGDIGPGTVDAGYPQPITKWGWGEFGKNGINAALYSGAKCYFFAGTEYIRVTRGDIGPGTVDAGYPQPISNWGWGNFGKSGINTALYSGSDTPAPAPAPAPVKCTIGLDNYFIMETRSAFKDTNFVTVGIAVGSQPPQNKTIPLGDVGKSDAAYNLSMYFQDIQVAPGENVVLSYTILNAGHTDAGKVVQGLEDATDMLVGKAAAAIATVAGTAIGAALGASIGTAAIPLIGTALGVLAGWLTSETWGILFADCDGAVATAVHLLTFEDIQAAVSKSGGLVQTDDHPGTDSPSGCGANSHYNVKWSVK